MAPIGTITASSVEVAVDTVAWVAPKNTMLFDCVGSKLVPVIVTVVPTGPLVGEKEVMVGGCIYTVTTQSWVVIPSSAITV